MKYQEIGSNNAVTLELNTVTNDKYQNSILIDKTTLTN